MNSYPRKILFVAMINSIHTARWLSQFADEKTYDVHLFSSVDASPHPIILKSKCFTIHNGNLEEVIDKIKPDIVHTLEMQHSAYLVLPIRKKRKNFPLWFYSCWGSDIRWFSRYRDHRKKIGEVLFYIDALFSEDIESIKKAINSYFYKNIYFQVQGPGGFKVDEMRKLSMYVAPSKRKIIAVKGYVGWVYRPETVLSALLLCSDLLKNEKYRIVIYAAGELDLYVKKLVNKGVDVELLNWTPNYNDVLRLFSMARVNIASSLSDGIPNTMLEGMIMGAFPIQSKSKPVAGYIRNYDNGILLDPLDIKGFARAIKMALIDDGLVDKAAMKNFDLIKKKLDYSLVKRRVIDFYESFFKGYCKSKTLCSLKKFYWVTIGRSFKISINILGGLIKKIIMFNKIKKMKSSEIFYSKRKIKDFSKRLICKINPTYRKIAVMDDKMNYLIGQVELMSKRPCLKKRKTVKN